MIVLPPTYTNGNKAGRVLFWCYILEIDTEAAPTTKQFKTAFRRVEKERYGDPTARTGKITTASKE